MVLAETKEPGHDGRRGELDEDGVVHTVGVKGVLDLETALDLVGFDHGCKDRVYGKWRPVMDQLAVGGRSTEPVRYGENGAQVIFNPNETDQRLRYIMGSWLATSSSATSNSIPEGCDASAPPRASL